MKRFRSRSPAVPIRLIWLTFGVMFVTGCDTNPMSGRVRFEISLEAVSGNDQVVGAGGSASAPLIVRAVDQNSTPRSGMVIDWNVTSGDGSLSTPSSITNSSGQAQVVYTSGDSAGDVEVRASLSLTASGSMASRQVDPVVFKITTSAAANAFQCPQATSRRRSGEPHVLIPAQARIHVGGSRSQLTLAKMDSGFRWNDAHNACAGMTASGGDVASALSQEIRSYVQSGAHDV